MAFAFTYLTGTEIAGYTSINALIQSIDTQLTSRIPNKDTSGTGAFNAYVPVYDSTQASGFSQGLITSSNILNDTIVNADINSAAGIVDTKLATISTAGKVSRSAIDSSGSSAGQVLTSTGSSATATWQAASIVEANLASGAVTLVKLAAAVQALLVPTGTIAPFAGLAASKPTGWFNCDGSSFASNSLSVGMPLYDLLVAAGWSALPDLRGRTIIGVGTGTELTAALGVTPAGMAATVTLTSAQSGLPAHAHSVTNFNTVDNAGNHTHTINADQNNTPRASGGSDVNKWFDSGASRSTNGAGAHNHNIPDHNTNDNSAANAASAHTNIQPSLPLNYIIKG